MSAVDTFGFAEDKAFSLKVLAALSVSTTSLRAGRISRPYSMTLKPTGGKGPFVWTLADGTLPNGLALDPVTGKIAGIATELGTFTPTFQVTDGLGATSSPGFTLLINP